MEIPCPQELHYYFLLPNIQEVLCLISDSLFTMPCQLGYTIFCALSSGTLGFVLSMIVLAPTYFSSTWSEKNYIEQAIVVAWPCIGAIFGLVYSIGNADQVSSRRPESDQRSERQQRSSRVSDSAQRPKSPQTRNQLARTVTTQPLQGTMPRHLHPTLM